MTLESSIRAGSQRPVAITVVCIILAVLAALAVIGLATLFTAVTVVGAVAAVPGVTLIFSAASVIVMAVCAYGLWIMKKWALFLYTALIVVNVILSFVSGAWSIIGQAIPLVLLGICWAYQSRMT